MSEIVQIKDATIATYCLAVPPRVAVENLRPLKSIELAALDAFLGGQGSSLEAMLGLSDAKRTTLLTGSSVDAGRVNDLINRAGQITLEIQRWTEQGIWILIRSNPAYPAQWRKRLAGAAPAILFGVGQPGIFEQDSVAIVGSRNAEEASLQFTRKTATVIARTGTAIVSGGARGIDREAMTAAITHGGAAIGIMSDSLTKAIREAEVRQFLDEGQLVLASPYRPDAGFSVGTAMGRNKLIYCLSTAAVVVATDVGKGGTWAGAVENLKNGWVPLYVRSEVGAPVGNCVLLEYSIGGRRAIPLGEIPEDGVLPPPLGFETPTDMVQLALS